MGQERIAGGHTSNQGNLLILEVELDTGTHSIAIGCFTIARQLDSDPVDVGS